MLSHVTMNFVLIYVWVSIVLVPEDSMYVKQSLRGSNQLARSNAWPANIAYSGKGSFLIFPILLKMMSQQDEEHQYREYSLGFGFSMSIESAES